MAKHGPKDKRILARWAEALLSWLSEALDHEFTGPPAAGRLLGHHLGKLFSHLQINCVLDVGANQGQYGLFLRRTGYLYLKSETQGYDLHVVEGARGV